MSLLDFDPTQAPDLTVLEDGTEIQVVVSAAMIKTVETSFGPVEQLNVCFEVVGQDGVDDIWYSIWGPGYKQSKEKEVARFQRRLKRFMEDMSVEPAAEWSPEDFIGATAWAVVGIDTYEGIDRNKIKSFLRKGK